MAITESNSPIYAGSRTKYESTVGIGSQGFDERFEPYVGLCEKAAPRFEFYTSALNLSKIRCGSGYDVPAAFEFYDQTPRRGVEEVIMSGN